MHCKLSIAKAAFGITGWEGHGVLGSNLGSVL